MEPADTHACVFAGHRCRKHCKNSRSAMHWITEITHRRAICRGQCLPRSHFDTLAPCVKKPCSPAGKLQEPVRGLPNNGHRDARSYRHAFKNTNPLTRVEGLRPNGSAFECSNANPHRSGTWRRSCSAAQCGAESPAWIGYRGPTGSGGSTPRSARQKGCTHCARAA